MIPRASVCVCVCYVCVFLLFLQLVAYPTASRVVGGGPLRRCVLRRARSGLCRVFRLGRGRHGPEDRRRSEGGDFLLVSFNI